MLLHMTPMFIFLHLQKKRFRLFSQFSPQYRYKCKYFIEIFAEFKFADVQFDPPTHFEFRNYR